MWRVISRPSTPVGSRSVTTPTTSAVGNPASPSSRSSRHSRSARWSGSSLTTYVDVAGLDEPHHVPVQTRDLVQAGNRPLVEPFRERPVDQRRMLAGLGDLQSHVSGRSSQFAEEGDEELGRLGAVVDRHDELLRVGLEDRAAGEALQAHLVADLQRQRCEAAPGSTAIDTSRSPSRWHSARR